MNVSVVLCVYRSMCTHVNRASKLVTFQARIGRKGNESFARFFVTEVAHCKQRQSSWLRVLSHLYTEVMYIYIYIFVYSPVYIFMFKACVLWIVSVGILLWPNLLFYCDQPYYFIVTNLIILLWPTLLFYCDQPYYFIVTNLIILLWPNLLFYCDKSYYFIVTNLIILLWPNLLFYCDQSYYFIVTNLIILCRPQNGK
jgi:hypothetical protein